MVDLKSLSDKELRELLLKHDDSAPPVNANTRPTLEKRLKAILDENHEISGESKSLDISNVMEINEVCTPPRTPPIVHFETKAAIRHEYEREYTPSYCRKSLSEYRDKTYDSPKFNLLDRPGCTPHINKHEIKRKSSKDSKPSGLTGILMVIAVFLAIGLGVYLMLTWDPSFSNPLGSK